MSASHVGEDRAGVRSLGERERKARSNGHCPRASFRLDQFHRNKTYPVFRSGSV